jgi:hypothetical protein
VNASRLATGSGIGNGASLQNEAIANAGRRLDGHFVKPVVATMHCNERVVFDFKRDVPNAWREQTEARAAVFAAWTEQPRRTCCHAGLSSWVTMSAAA